MNEKVKLLEDKQVESIYEAHIEVGGIGFSRDRLSQISVLEFIQQCTRNGLILIPYVLSTNEITELQRNDLDPVLVKLFQNVKLLN